MRGPSCLRLLKSNLVEVAPENNELGVMLPYTPLHHLLFAAGAPEALVMTSANRSSEPIAYEDEEALDRLSEIADAFLIGQRPIARRVDDSRGPGRSVWSGHPSSSTRICSGRSRSNSQQALDSCVRRRPEKYDHTGCRRPGIRQPAHRRLGALRVAPRVPGNDSGSDLDV